ncbi:MAG TPA: sialidase family protein [Polyangia bacterium]|jgi:hypothetical protein
MTVSRRSRTRLLCLTVALALAGCADHESPAVGDAGLGSDGSDAAPAPTPHAVWADSSSPTIAHTATTEAAAGRCVATSGQRAYLTWTDNRQFFDDPNFSSIHTARLAMSADDGQTFGADVRLIPEPDLQHFTSWQTARPAVAVDGLSGRVYVAMEWQVGSSAEIFVTSSADGAAFAPPVKVSGEVGADSDREPIFPAIAVGAGGRVLVAWIALSRFHDNHGYVWFASSDDSGATFSTPRQLNDAAVLETGSAVALAADGERVHVAGWFEGVADPARGGLWVASSLDRGDTFAPFVQVSSQPFNDTNPVFDWPSAVVDSAGALHVAWTSAPSGELGPCLTTSDDHGLTFHTACGLGTMPSPTTPPSAVSLAAGAQRSLALTWTTQDGPTRSLSVAYSSDGGANFSPLFPVDAIATGSRYDSCVSFTTSGNLLLAWTDERGCSAPKEQMGVPMCDSGVYSVILPHP